MKYSVFNPSAELLAVNPSISQNLSKANGFDVDHIHHSGPLADHFTVLRALIICELPISPTKSHLHAETLHVAFGKKGSDYEGVAIMLGSLDIFNNMAPSADLSFFTYGMVIESRHFTTAGNCCSLVEGLTNGISEAISEQRRSTAVVEPEDVLNFESPAYLMGREELGTHPSMISITVTEDTLHWLHNKVGVVFSNGHHYHMSEPEDQIKSEEHGMKMLRNADKLKTIREGQDNQDLHVCKNCAAIMMLSLTEVIEEPLRVQFCAALEVRKLWDFDGAEPDSSMLSVEPFHMAKAFEVYEDLLRDGEPMAATAFLAIVGGTADSVIYSINCYHLTRNGAPYETNQIPEQCRKDLASVCESIKSIAGAATPSN